MTRLFAAVRSPAEAAQVLRAGFDGLFVDDPALAVEAPAVLRPATAPPAAPALQLVDARGSHRLERFDDTLPDEAALDAAVAAGAAGILLAARGRLLDGLGIAGIGALRERCAARGLLCALAGGLEAPDLPRLMVVAPDLIVIGRALRDADGTLNESKLPLLRDLVPRARPSAAPAVVPPRPASRRLPDVIFLRDLVASIAIGAYAEERGRRQRVRFSVEAELSETGRPTRDMRDVVSYDLFSDAIAALTTGRHVDFVETLAEEIAAAVLRHPRIRRVRVTVEKLDVGPGAVGVSIERCKDGSTTPAG